ncbi:MAG: alpha/beta fold hydrolase [Spirochaetales bacterium]
MKKIYKTVWYVLFMVAVLTACSKESAEMIDDSRLTLAQNLVVDMTNDTFITTTACFTSELASQLDETILKNGWDVTVKDLGRHIAHHSVQGVVDGEYIIVTVLEEYENSGLKITFAYNEQNEIAGINLNYAVIEKPLVSNDVYEEVAMTLGTSLLLDAVLTLPKGEKNPPVVLLVHGSGSTDKNESIFANKPFEDIAVGLAKRGIATFRYDKRYYTYPQEAEKLAENITVQDEVLYDVTAGIDLLSKLDKINTDKIYVLGHSLGGSLTSAIAYENTAVRGIISVAGTLRPLYEISYDQNKAIEEHINNGDFDAEITESVTSQMIQVEKDIKTLRGDLENISNEEILLGLPAGYQKSLKKYAGENFIDKIDIPVLILQGTADFQVYADKDFILWENALHGRDNAVLKLYEGLNHLMMPTNGKQDISEYQIKGTVSAQVLDDIANFIIQQ